METDDGHACKIRRVILPEELIENVLQASLQAASEWQVKNDHKLEDIVLVAVMRVVGDVLEEMMVLGPNHVRTLQ